MVHLYETLRMNRLIGRDSNRGKYALLLANDWNNNTDSEQVVVHNNANNNEDGWAAGDNVGHVDPSPDKRYIAAVLSY